MSDNIKCPEKRALRYPLTVKMRKKQDVQDKLQQSLENEENSRKLEVQEKSLNIVKEHILRRKQEFLCHKLERMHLNTKQKKDMEAKVLQKYKINISNSITRQKIADKLMDHKRKKEININHRQQRMVNIIQKLITEIDEKENPPKKKIFKRIDKMQFLNLPDTDVDEEDLVTDELNEIVDEEEEEHIEYWEDMDIQPKGKKDKKKDGKKAKTDKSSKKSKSTKSTKTKSTKKSSKPAKGSKKGSAKGKMKKVEHRDLQHVIYPITNPRNRLKPEDKEPTGELFSSLTAYNDFLNEKKNYSIKEATYAAEKNFSSKPDVVFFSDFENNKIYKQRITVYNKSCEITYCNFQYIISNNELCNLFFEVEQIGIKKLYPGKGFNINITFRPRKLKYLQGKIMFLTRRFHEIEFKQFDVPIECEMESVKIGIFPQNVIFRSIPIWKINPGSYNNFKIIQVRNDMIKECLLIIRKTQDPLDSSSDIENQDFEETEYIPIEQSNNALIRLSKDTSSTMINDLINVCFDHIDHIFYFETYYVLIPPKTTLDLKVYLKNAPFVGAHVEVFEFEFLEGATEKINTIYSETIMLQVEITGKFIITDSEYIDYNVCVLNSIYQQEMKIYNSSKTRVNIGFQLPSGIKQYVSIYPQTFFLGPGLHGIFSFRFCPCPNILDTKYYDPNAGIIHFPIKICILLPKNSKIPPTIISVYALLTEADHLILRPGPNEDVEFDPDLIPIILLGPVSTHETLTSEIELWNGSASIQEFGFLNLPESIVLDPNYGFGSVKPNEIKKLKICFSPSVEDMIAAESSSERNATVEYKLTCTTAHKLGEIRCKEEKPTKIAEREPSLESSSMQNIVEQSEMLQNIGFALDYELPDVIEEEDEAANFENYILLNHEYSPAEESPPEEESELVLTKNLTIILKATIVHYWTELSYQNIVFPNTPLGSYSSMSLNIAALNNSSGSECVCGYKKHKYMQNFRCHFEVFGGSEDISIEPICGDLQKNQKIKLLLIARPTIENHLLQKIAKIYKTERLEKMQTKKDEPKKKKKLSGKITKQASSLSQFTPSEKGSFHNSDFYLAEKQISSFLQPYHSKASFVFVVKFPPEFCKADEILYLTTECNIIRPNFTTNLPTQHLDFGPTAISTRPKQIIAINNISRKEIHPKISPVSPLGPFICATQRNINVEMEHILKVPITFAPEEENAYNEYFEINSGNTVESLLVVGEGVTPVFEITPIFNVCRLQAKLGKSADCIFQIENKCRAPISIQVKKVYELKGKIEPKPIIIKEKKTAVKESVEVQKKGDKKKEKKEKKSKSDRKSNATMKKKGKKYSEELTEHEEYSLPKNFKINHDEAQYNIQNESGDIITVEPFSKASVKIRFGIVKVKQAKKKKDKSKKDKSKKDKNAKSEQEEIKPEPPIIVVLPPPDKTLKYVAKYNIMLGSIELIRDFVIIGEFK